MLSCLICHGDRFQCADLKSVEHESFHLKCICLCIIFFFIEVKGPDSSAYFKYFNQCTYARQHRYIVATQWVTFVYIDISTYRLQFYSILLIFYFNVRISGMEYTIVLLKMGMVCDKTMESKYAERIAKHVRNACVIH